MDKLRFGIVGIGNMGTAHAICIADGNVDNAKLTAVCDLKEKRLNFCKERFENVQCFTDYNAMFDSGLIDAVIIAVPHKEHANIAIDAFSKGLNVLVEKPIDISVSKALELNECARKSGKAFGIMFNQRTNELFAKARSIVKNGELGKLKRTVWIVTNWYRTQKYYDSGSWRATWSGEGGGVLLNQAPHNLDLWQWICGMPISVTAFCDEAKYHKIEVEDDATIVTRFDNGAIGTFITTTGEFPGTNRLEVSGTLGKIVIEEGVLKWWKLKVDEEEYRYSAQEGFAEIENEYIEIPQTTKESAHKGILLNFTNHVLFGEELLAPGYDGIYELSISNAAYLSQWKNNSPVSIPFDTSEFDDLMEKKAEKSSFVDKELEVKTSENLQARWQVRW